MCTHLPVHKHVHSGASGGVGMAPSSEAGSIRMGEMGQPYGTRPVKTERIMRRLRPPPSQQVHCHWCSPLPLQSQSLVGHHLALGAHPHC